MNNVNGITHVVYLKPDKSYGGWDDFKFKETGYRLGWDKARGIYGNYGWIVPVWDERGRLLGDDLWYKKFMKNAIVLPFTAGSTTEEEFLRLVEESIRLKSFKPVNRKLVLKLMKELQDA